MKIRPSIRRFAFAALLLGTGPVGCGLDINDSGLFGPAANPNYRPSVLIFAPPLVRAVRGYRDTVDVQASYADALTADLSGLPPGNDARFVYVAGLERGRLTWTPTQNDSGPYAVAFAATGFGGTLHASTTIYVTNHLLDAPPRITAPAETTITVGSELRLDVRAEDPDGDPIFDWGMRGNLWWKSDQWRFEVSPTKSGATLVYTPTEAGTLVFTFEAANFLTGSARTIVAVSGDTGGG